RKHTRVQVASNLGSHFFVYRCYDSRRSRRPGDRSRRWGGDGITDIGAQLVDEESACVLLEHALWPCGPVCPRCGSVDDSYFLRPPDGGRATRAGGITTRRVWKCAVCRQQYSVLVGTVFENSK